jgi:serralysin
MANSGNVFLDVLAYRSWLDVGGDRNITYYFDDTSPYHLWSPFEKAVWRNALQEWASVANITTQEVFSSAGADVVETWTNSQILTAQFGLDPNGNPWVAAHYLPLAGGGSAGEYNNAYLLSTTPQGSLTPGGYGYWLFVHEIGHGLGLSHPHGMVQLENEPFFPGVNVAGDLGDYGYNQQVYTIMSYNRASNVAPFTSPFNGFGQPATPMAFDIAAIQNLYGSNTTYHSGSDTYLLPDDNAAGTVWQCIWDTGGTDTIRYDGKRNATIDLRAATLVFGDPIAGGALSKADSIYGGFTIAKGVVIENAIGGNGNDTIIGNSTDNVIDGRAGDDAVIYSGPRSAYTVTDLGGGSVRVTGPDGNDTISNVERLVFSDTTVTLTPAPPPAPASSSFKLVPATRAADFNGDGKADILWQNDNGAPAVWLMNGVNVLSTGPALSNPGTSWHEKAAADSTETARPISCGRTITARQPSGSWTG